MKNIFFLIVALLFSLNQLSAQLVRPDVAVQRSNGSQMLNPWAGGLNNPQFSEVDLDGDLVKDLLVFDRSSNNYLPFLNSGTPFSPDYSFAPEFIQYFPQAEKFVLLRDFNCDGIEDLYCYYRNEGSGETGISVYKAKRDVNGNVGYELFKELLRYTEIGQTFQYNLYTSNIDLPDINDIDGDGDLDILNFHIGGGYVELFNNVSVENGWGCDSLKFELADNCWGRFYESGISTALDLSPAFDSCANWAGWTALRNNAGPRHAGSTLLSLDMNADGLRELILGDIAFDNLVLANNSGNRDTALILTQSAAFPSVNPVSITAFPAAFYLDVNNDNIKDLIASPNADDISVNDRVAWHYTNTQADDNPVFVLDQQDFLVSEMIELGSTAAPAFVDFNGDGLMDLVIGNYGIFINASTYRTRLTAFENIGTANAPIFKLVNSDFASLQQYNLRRLVPTFGDLDGDGDFDMIIGLEDGTLLRVNNTGTPTSPLFSTPIANFSGIDVGQHAAPNLIDIDRDNDLDLIIGERNGNSNFARNTGTASSPQFSTILNSQTFGFIDTRITNQSLDGNSAPHLVDHNGNFLLFMGSESGEIWVYDSIDNNTLGTFRRISSDFDAVEVGRQSILSVADINADGLPDVVAGNKRGGVSLFSAPYPTALKLTESEISYFDFYPNPAKNQITIDFNNLNSLSKTISIIDAFGRVVKRFAVDENIETYHLDIQDLASGFYVISFASQKSHQSKTLLINK
jgi:hypothetical protein